MIDERLSKLLGVVAVVLSLFLLVHAYNAIQEGRYIGKDIMPTNTISVSAAGEAFAKPDVARISVSVVKEAKTVLEAQKSHTEAINQVVSFLKNSGIEDKDIKTSAYNIYPQYDYVRDRGSVFRGYQITQTLNVKIRNLEKAGEILVGVTSAGANEVGGISFIVDDDEGLKREARQKAIALAKTKANQLEDDLGIRFGKLVNFYESGGEYPIYKYATEAMGVGGAAPAPAPEIPAGENKITITVNLTYEIK